MNPHHPTTLQALTTCWSLRRAWSIYRDTDTTRSPLRSPVYGVIGARGGHADPVATGDPIADNPGRIAAAVEEAVWLSRSALRLHAPGTGPALAQITAALPVAPVQLAADVHQWLAAADRVVRRALNLDPDVARVIGDPKCLACRTRRLIVNTSAPRVADRTIACANPACRCHGPLCPCQMPTRVEGGIHIWATPAVIPAAA